MAPMLPDFLIIGAVKSGTTSLFNLLQGHVDVNMCLIKEPNFFNISEGSIGNWELGMEWYKNLFKEKPGLRGEASTSYTKFPATLGVASRIHQTNSNVRLIYLVRNPVDRAISHYLHNVLAGSEKRTIHAAFESNVNQYLLASMYFLHLQQYLAFFSRTQVCILIAETMWLNPNETLDRLCDFLQVSKFHLCGNQMKRENATGPRAVARFIESPLNDAQERLCRAMATESVGETASARTFADALGFGPDDLKRMVKRLIDDVSALYNLLDSSVDEWASDFGNEFTIL